MQKITAPTKTIARGTAIEIEQSLRTTTMAAPMQRELPRLEGDLCTAGQIAVIDDGTDGDVVLPIATYMPQMRRH